jgi:uncharacterized protein
LKKYIYLFFFFVNFCFAQEFPQQPTPPKIVNDFAQLLQPQEVNALEQKLVSFNDSTSSQLAIVIINSLNGYEVADYSFKLAQKWGIGQKEKDNGVLLLISKTDRKVFIATGYGVEAYLPDAICKRIVSKIIVPQFKNGNYFQALDEATTAMQGYLSGKFKPEPKKNKKSMSPISFMLIVFFIIFIIYIINKNSGGGGGRNGGYRTFGSSGFIPFPINFGGGSGGSSWGGGSSGFGGFGGGSFGGGGAGGDW